MAQHEDKLIKSCSMSLFDKFVVWFCVIDALFLTYLPFVAMTISTPLIILWFIKHYKMLLTDRTYKKCILLMIIMLLSIIIGYVGAAQTLKDNIKVWIIQVLCYQYYFMFRYYKTKFNYSVNVKKLLMLFLLLGFALAIYYIVNRGGFIQFKTIINQYDGVVGGLGKNYSSFRYNFLWTDANNPAYAFAAVMTFLLIRYRLNMIEKLMVTVFACIPILASMSTGGLYSFFLGLGLSFIASIIRGIKKGYITFNIKSLFIFIVILLTIGVLKDNILDFLDNPTMRQSYERTSTNDDQLGYRMNIWTDVINKEPIYKHIFTGVGPSIVIDGVSRKPHNGFLYLIYSYGMIATYLFLNLFFFKRKGTSIVDYFYTVPLWIGFTINGIIGNPKFLIIIMLLAVETRFSQKNIT